MAILGVEGRFALRREAPDPLVITPDSIAKSVNSFRVSNQDFWSGDEVYLVSPNGIPLSSTAVPEGSGTYFGSRWDLGPNRIHITDESDQFYLDQGDGTIETMLLITDTGSAVVTDTGARISLGDAESPGAGDLEYFYNRGPAIKSGTFFIYRDQLDRISLYPTRATALVGSRAQRYPLFVLDFGYLVFAPAGTLEYDNAIGTCVDRIGSFLPPNVTDETKLADICDFAPYYEQPTAGTGDFGNADLTPRRWVAGFPWYFVCNLQGWSLELSAPSVDTTAVGVKFGEAVKSLVTGGGSMDFFVDRVYNDDGSVDTTALMRLLMLTERGSKAEAEFWVVRDRAGSACDGLLPGDLYYSTEILTVNCAINLRPQEMVVGSANFVTTGEISLREGTN